ncbi:ferritin-like domain-containing protein [Paenibacillus sp. NPDC056579]|uniref:ferritin-like domain-containing protein n=1 Tax=Paenibacillus sp. NPDC056579 TaxID=3345871 RepID=UPI0036BB8784
MYYRINDETNAARSVPYYSMGWRFRQNGLQSPYHVLQESLHFIQEAVAGESNAEKFYEKLLELAPSEEDRSVITSIREDERRQLQILREIYLAFTGREVPASALMEYKEPASYKDGLRIVIFNKWKTNQNAGNLLAAMPTGYYQNLLAKIAVDNVTIVSKFNYLLAKLPHS